MKFEESGSSETQQNAGEALIENLRHQLELEREKSAERERELMHENKLQLAVILAQQTIIENQQRQLHTDEKTGLASERGLEHFIERKNTAENGSLVVVFFDINKFKIFNDTYGHEVGDAALRAVGDYLKKRFRKDSDQVVQIEDNQSDDNQPDEDVEIARPHGDEFIVVCANTTEEQIMKTLQKEEVALEVEHQGQKIEVGLSFGATTYVAGETFKQAKERADAAMYVMKRSRPAPDSDPGPDR
jgi:GGDEF domain-containing protein